MAGRRNYHHRGGYRFNEVLKQNVLMEPPNDFEEDDDNRHQDDGGARSPSPPTHSWPLMHSHRTQVRSCIEFSGSQQTGSGNGSRNMESPRTPRTPMSEATGLTAMTHRLSNPFLLDFGLLTNDQDRGVGGEDGDDDDEQDYSTSHSLSLLSNEEVGDDDDDDTLSSTGTLSEVFESLSRFSEDCLASVEALTSPQATNARTPRATDFSFSSSVFPGPGLGPSCASTSASTSATNQAVAGCSYVLDKIFPAQTDPHPHSACASSSRHNPFVVQQHGKSRKQHNRQLLSDYDTGAYTYSDQCASSSHSRRHRHRQHTTNYEATTPTTTSNILKSPLFEFGNEVSSHAQDRSRNPQASSNSIEPSRRMSMPVGRHYSQAAAAAAARHEEEARQHFQDLLLLPDEINSIVSFTVGQPSSATESAVSCLDWQERCMELEIALQRFGEQAARVRLFLRDKLAELERRVVEAEQRADEAEDKVRVMEQQLSGASVAGSTNGTSWASLGEDTEKLCTLQSVVREKERVISRLECQVEEQRLLRLQESRQVEEKASKIKDWVSNKLRDLEDQNELLREQNQKCETQLELLRARLTQLNNLQSSKAKDRHSTEDSSRGSYEGDRPPSDESPPPDSGDGRGIGSQQISTQRPLSATAACIAAIKRRSGAFDTPEERLQRRKSSNLSNSTPGEHERVSRDSRNSRVDSGSVDMETPQSLSPRSPSNDLEPLDNNTTSNPSSINVSNGIPMSRSSTTSSTSHSHVPPQPPQRGLVSGSSSSIVSSSNINQSQSPNVLNNNNVINMVSSPVMHSIPAPIPVSIPNPTPLCISHSPSPATPIEVVMVGGAESTQSLTNEPSATRRPPSVPPRKCRTRSPTPNTSIGSDVTDSTIGDSCSISLCSSSRSSLSGGSPDPKSGSEPTKNNLFEQAGIVQLQGSARLDLKIQPDYLTQGTSPGHSTPPNEEEDASLLRARLDAECQQLARDLQAAVRELVRPEQLGGLSLVDAKGNFAHHNGLEVVLGTTGRRSHNSQKSSSGAGSSNHSTSVRARALDENHDYSEIYTPSGDEKLGLTQAQQPPPPPMHRFPSWESRIYEVAAGGLKIPSNMNTSNSEEIGSSSMSRHRLHHHSLGINFSIPVYTTVKGRASQIRSAPFSGDSTDSSDGEEMGSGSGSGPSHPISSGETDLSSPGKSVASSIPNSLSPRHRSSSSPSKSIRREPSFESEISDDYAIPPDAYASETNSLDIALSSGCLSLTPNVSQFSTVKSSGSSNANLPVVINSVEGSPRKESLEKVGYLTKLGGKLKTWRKRWFVLKNGSLTYWKSPHDVHRRSTGREILLDDNCRVTRGEGAATFEIATEKKTYYLTADSPAAVDDWVRVLQNVVRRNATKLVLSMEGNKPTLQGWLVKVKNGHAKRCWCVLIGKMFLSFKSPSDTVASGQVNMKDARVEDVDRVSDSDNDEKDDDGLPNSGEKEMTIGIFPSHQSPIYLHLPTKQDKDSWLYHLTIVSGKGPSAGTQFEQLIHKLMEVNGDPSSSLWKNPLLLHSKESIVSPLTSLPSEVLQTEAIKLFKSCQLFMSVPLDSSGIDYHVALAQNALQLCLEHPELQAELLCALVKQTSRTITFKNSPHASRALNKIKHSRFLLNATHSLFLCDSSSGHGKVNNGTTVDKQGASLTSAVGNGSLGRVNNGHSSLSNSPVSKSPSRSNRSSPAKSSKSAKASSSSVPSSPLLSSSHSLRGLSPEVKSSSVRTFVFIQGWQLLSLAVSLFLPKNNKLLWYLKQHLLRNAETKTEGGKYAAYCQRSIERTLSNGPRLFKPSRMEVLSILMKNPFHHSLPHSVPVHYVSGAYTVVGFDGSTTVEEFLISLCHEIGCREPNASGFALTEDDPFDKDLDHSLRPDEKICDVISQWETVLREKGSGRFETRRAVTLMFKSRIYRRSALLHETDKERLLLCYQANQAVVAGKFPLTRELALELAALMAQIDGGDYKGEKGRGSGQSVIQALEKYYPLRYRESNSHDESKALSEALVEKWCFLKGKSTADCVRIYLTCTRKWNFFGATLFSVTVRGCYALEDDASVWVAICEDGIAILDSQSLQQIVKYSFTSVQTFGGALDDQFMVVVDDLGKKHRLLFGGMTKHKILEMTRLVADYINACCQHSIYGACSKLTRHNSLKSSRLQSHTTLPPVTPRMERKYHYDVGSSSPRMTNDVQRTDSARRSPRT